MEYNQANIIQQMIHQAVEDLVQSPTTTEPPTVSSATITNTVPLLAPASDVSTLSELQSVQQANATMTITQQQMMKQMQDMLTMMQNMHTNDINNRLQPYRPNTRTGRRLEPLPWNYCWTHGYCKHASANCTDKAPQHQDAATMNNTMGGSLKNIKRWKKETNQPDDSNN